MGRPRRALIRPHGWHEDVEAHVDPDTVEATHFDVDTGVVFRFGFGEFELIEVYHDEEPVAEPHPCVCAVQVLMSRGCVCGHLTKRYKAPR